MGERLRTSQRRDRARVRGLGRDAGAHERVGAVADVVQQLAEQVTLVGIVEVEMPLERREVATRARARAGVDGVHPDAPPRATRPKAAENSPHCERHSASQRSPFGVMM